MLNKMFAKRNVIIKRRWNGRRFISWWIRDTQRVPSNFWSEACTRNRSSILLYVGRVNCNYTCTYATARTVRAAYVDGVAVWLWWLVDSPPLLSVTRVAAVPEQTWPKTFVSCAEPPPHVGFILFSIPPSRNQERFVTVVGRDRLLLSFYPPFCRLRLIDRVPWYCFASLLGARDFYPWYIYIYI